jgi:hypothetical protein
MASKTKSVKTTTRVERDRRPEGTDGTAYRLHRVMVKDSDQQLGWVREVYLNGIRSTLQGRTSKGAVEAGKTRAQTAAAVRTAS